ncbi:MAG: TetR/AcrR family transcriptional regulator [Sphingomonadaceae bacterium]
MGLREKQTAERKRRILDVADALIQQSGNTNFSMRMLAELSEVSPATPYNLFGSKDGIISASLARGLDRFFIEGLVLDPGKPLDFVASSHGIAVDILIEGKALMRPLHLYLLGVLDTLHHHRHIARSSHYWRTVAETAAEAFPPEIAGSIDHDILKFQLFSLFLGLVQLWIHGDIEDDVFRARAVYGALLIVSPSVAPDRREEIDSLLSAGKFALEKALSRRGRKSKAKPAIDVTEAKPA